MSISPANRDEFLPFTIRSARLRYLAFAVICAGMLWGLLAPGAFRFLRTNPYSPFSLVNDALLHCFAFCSATLWINLLFSENRSSRIKLVAICLAAFGVLSELAQFFIPTRNCDLLDLLANFAGILIGCRLMSFYVDGIGEREPVSV